MELPSYSNEKQLKTQNRQGIIAAMNPFQTKVRAKGEQIFQQMENEGKTIFNKDWWYGRIMEWSMKNEHFKTQMFRFVDVLPSLNSGSEVARHLKEYFAESGDELPAIFNMGAGLGSLAPGLMAGAVRKNITQMAKLFITGENPQEALMAIKKARKNSICFTVDILGEATLSEKEALEYQARYLELINWLAQDAQNWESNPQIDVNDSGPIPKVNVSVKLSALYSQINVKAWDRTKEILKERLRPIFQTAKQHGVFINLDMEQYSLKNLTLEVFEELIMDPEFRDYPHWGCVIQAYLRDSFTDVQKLVELAKRRKVPFTIRLVKGAYWDYETVSSDQKGWPIPVYTNKQESDANYEKCAFSLLENHAHIRVALGSHNARSLAACLVKAEELGLDKRHFEIQMLYGMADAFKRAFVKMGYRVREYAPVGELLPGMAYLVRRLLENTSNESFLRSKFADDASNENLFRDPGENLKATPAVAPRLENRFYNEPLLDFTLPEPRRKLQEALQRFSQNTGRIYPLVINGREIKTDRVMERHNPSRPSQLIGKISVAGANEAEAAVSAAAQAFESWSKIDPKKRAALVEKLADLILRDRYELMATQILEVGKPWVEADGDITEAIDFCRYYARDMRQMAAGIRVGHVAGETSIYHYEPRGVALVIAPWNFPLAILTGMVTAALVTGNTVIMKPAEQSSVIAAHLMRLLREAGFPAGVIHFVPGYGEEVGEYLVKHKNIDLIAFTGSKQVGLQIIEKSGRTPPGQRNVKRCVVEMGGKNAVIIDNDADLDEAIQAVIYSAFGFQGQKCSACSRVIVLHEVYDHFVSRLVEVARSIQVRPAEDPEAYLGPVVDKEAQAKILSMIEAGKQEAKLIFQGEVPHEGYFIPPTIFANVKPNARIAREEIFGPVLAIIRAGDMDEAVKIANDTEYGLTGGFFSRSPANIEKVKREFEVGNLYINRGITGAMVDRHPFGGFKMSGVGSKTGGPDYLKQFVEPRCITENTLRRGFAPVEE